MSDKDLYIGMGATICYWSDRSPATVIQILQDGKRVIIQEDKFTRTDNNGISELQEYDYERDPNGATYVVTLRKDGRYKISKSNTIVALGARRKYYDPSF